MKKLIFLVCLLIGVGMSAKMYAQSTGTTPYPGATHNYSVSSTADSYSWKVYKGNMSTEVTSFPGSGIQAFTPSGNSVAITWATDAVVDDEYIVVVEETVGLCKNSKGLPVKITASEFDLTVSGGGDACYTNSVVVAWTGGTAATDVTYDHGVATITYTVTASGVGASETWSFKPDFTYDTGNIAQNSITVVKGSTLTADGSGIYTATGPGDANITAIIENNNSYDNTSAVDAQDFVATLTLSNVSSGTGAVEKTGAGAGANTDDVNVGRPDTSQITTD